MQKLKKVISLIMIALMLTVFVGCGDSKTINGITYDTYGFFNEKTDRNPDIEYKIIVGNVIWSIILIESIIFPVYFVGFSLWEPYRAMPVDKTKNGVVE